MSTATKTVADAKFVEALQSENERLHARVLDLESLAGITVTSTPVQAVPETIEVKRGHIWRAESDEPWLYHEEISFIEDSGYDRNFIDRARAIVGKAFGIGKTKDPLRCGEHVNGEWHWTRMPPFQHANRIAVTVRIIPGSDEPS